MAEQQLTGKDGKQDVRTEKRKVPEEVKAAEKAKGYRREKKVKYASILSQMKPKCGNYEACGEDCPLGDGVCAYRAAKQKKEAYEKMSDEQVKQRLEERENRKALSVEIEDVPNIRRNA